MRIDSDSPAPKRLPVPYPFPHLRAEVHLPTVRRKAGTYPFGELPWFLLLLGRENWSFVLDPVLTDLFAAVLHYSCRKLPFHGAAVGYGRKFSMTQTSVPPLGSGWVKAMRRPSGCRAR